MGLKTRLSSHCTKRANNGVNLLTSRKVNTRLARPIKMIQGIPVLKPYANLHLDKLDSL